MISELESLGLTKREIDAYLALLEIGTSPIGRIVKKSKVPSSKVYEILDKLIEKGLVSFIIKNNTKYFSASEPETLLDMIEEKRNSIEKIIPELKNKQNSEKKEEVTLFEGIDGMKTALRKVLRILKPKEEYLVYVSASENLENESSKIFYNNFNLQRKDAKIITKLLIHNRQKEIMKKEYLKTLLKDEVKFTDFDFPSRLGIFKNHVLMINDGKNISSILIRSEDIYKKYKDFFEIIWKQSKS